MSFFNAFIVLMLLNASVINTEMTISSSSVPEDDCIYCIHKKRIEAVEIGTAISASDEFCGCFKNGDPPICNFLNKIDTKTYLGLETHCEKIIEPINKILTNNKDMCQISPTDVATGSPGPDDSKNDTLSAPLVISGDHNETVVDAKNDTLSPPVVIAVGHNRTGSPDLDDTKNDTLSAPAAIAGGHNGTGSPGLDDTLSAPVAFVGGHNGTGSPGPDDVKNDTLSPPVPIAGGHNGTGSPDTGGDKNGTLPALVTGTDSNNGTGSSTIDGAKNDTLLTPAAIMYSNGTGAVDTDDTPSALVDGADRSNSTADPVDPAGGINGTLNDTLSPPVVPAGGINGTDGILKDTLSAPVVPAGGINGTDGTLNDTLSPPVVPAGGINGTDGTFNDTLPPSVVPAGGSNGTGSPSTDGDKNNTSSHSPSSGDKSGTKKDTDGTVTADHLSRSASSSDGNKYSLGAILTSIFLSFGAGILIAVLAKMLYNRYRKDSYVLPPDQRMQDM